MSQLLEDPTAPPSNNGNGHALANQPKRIAPVENDGPFANLLDTVKFEHLWRVAQMFASSTLVPVHFQLKPADCFIAAQMALRLGIDPFMFMQNTYVTSGKPGMEAKLAIALINSSGLFVGPLSFDLQGSGDDRGCTAWAISKATGEQVNGPRVTIKMAKDEGWHQRNPKWRNVPDLMLQYRAGAWFGRLQCPERLMGMQTADELEDVNEPRPVVSTVVPPVGVSRTRALANKITGTAPVIPDAATADPILPAAPAPLPSSEAEANQILEQAAQRTRQQDQPATDTDTDASADQNDYSDEAEKELADARAEVRKSLTGAWPDVVKIFRSKAKDAGFDRGTFDGGLVRTAGFGLTADKSTIDARVDLYYALLQKRWDPATGVVTPAEVNDA